MLNWIGIWVQINLAGWEFFFFFFFWKISILIFSQRTCHFYILIIKLIKFLGNKFFFLCTCERGKLTVRTASYYGVTLGRKKTFKEKDSSKTHTHTDREREREKDRKNNYVRGNEHRVQHWLIFQALNMVYRIRKWFSGKTINLK